MEEFKNWEYYGILFTNENDILYAKVKGEDEIRQAKIKNVKVTFSEETPKATIWVNLAGQGKRLFEIEPRRPLEEYECCIKFYKTKKDAIFGKNEVFPYRTPNNPFQAFSFLFGSCFHMDNGTSNEVYRYGWNGNSPEKAFYHIPTNETIIVNSDGWYFFNPWMKEKAEEWVNSTEYDVEDAYERFKDQVKVITFENEVDDTTEEEYLDEGNEMTNPIGDAVKLANDAVDIIERIINYYNL